MMQPEPETSLTLLERPNPFDARTIRTAIAYVPNQPLALYLKDVDRPVITLLDGRLVPPEQRLQVIPKAGQQLILAQDLGGGGGGKGIIRALAMVAVLAIAIFLPAIVGLFGFEFISAGWAMAAQAAVMAGGSLLVNAVLPPPSMKGSKQEQTYGWGGAQMTAQEGIPIPRQYGRMRRSGNVIESYLTTTLTQQWLNILIDFGWGPAASMSDIEINGNPISNYPNIWAETRMGYNDQAPTSNFSDVVNSYSQDTRIRSADGGATIVGTGTQTQGFEVEFTFPKGLWAGPLDDGVSYDPWTVNLRVSYRQVGGIDWTQAVRPRTTAGLPLNGLGQAPYWIAVTTQWTPNQQGTVYVLDVSYGVNDHRAGDAYTAILTVPVYDENGNPTGTQDITVTGSWIVNPAGPGGTAAPGAGADYLAITDYVSVTHTATWNKPVQARDVVRVDNLPPGHYEYKIEKIGASQLPGDAITTTTEDTTRRGEETWISNIREIEYATLSYPNKILLGLRALATDKLSGGALNVTALVEMAPSPAMGYKNEVAFDQPIAYFRMNDSGGTCADLTGQGHDGAYSGAPVKGQPGVIVGSPDASVRFAAGDSASIGTAPEMPSTGWACEAWLNPSALGGKLVQNVDASVYVELTAAGKLNFHFAGADHLSTAAMAVNQVHHVVVGVTPGGFLFMIDGAGEFVGSIASPTWTPTKIGGGYAGLIDEVALYDYAVQPGRFKQHYITGTQGLHSALEDRAPDNPIMVAIDELLNPLYGGQQSPALLDVEALTVAADFNDELVSDGLGGQINRHIFNGVYDQSETLWSAISRVGQMSRTVFMRSGTSYTCVCDAPSVRSQVFTMGNIKKDSFKQAWPALLDRANSVSGNFLDETNNWKKTPVRVMDEAAIAAGAALQEAASVDLFGITSPRAAWRELTYRLLASKAALQTVSIDCALEGLATRVGDVVGLQHDVPQWGAGGRLLKVISASKVQLDQQVTIELGNSYVVMIVMPAVVRGTGVVQSIAGNVVTLLNNGWNGSDRVSRLVFGGNDTKITEATLATGLAILTVDSPAGFAVGQNCSIYDVDVIESRDVSTGPSTTNTIDLATPFSSVPEDYSTYFFGHLTDIEDFRLSGIGRRSDQEMTLQLVKYDPTIFGDLEPTLPEAAVGADLIAVSNLVVIEAPKSTPQFPILAISWTPGKLTAGARIFVTRPGLAEWLGDDIRGQNFDQVGVTQGVAYTVRVVGYDSKGKSAPHATAPTVTITPQGTALMPQNVMAPYASACVVGPPASVTINWTANPGGDHIDHYEIRYGGTISNPRWANSTPLTPNPGSGASAATFASGPGFYLIVAVNTSGISSAVPTVLQALVGGSSGGSGGGGYGDPDPVPGLLGGRG